MIVIILLLAAPCSPLNSLACRYQYSEIDVLRYIRSTGIQYSVTLRSLGCRYHREALQKTSEIRGSQSSEYCGMKAGMSYTRKDVLY
jgi:hypothetical protein